MRKSNCNKNQTKWYKRVWKRMEIFSDWYMCRSLRITIFIGLFLVLVNACAIFLCDSWCAFIVSAVCSAVFHLHTILLIISMLIGLEPFEDK